MEPIEHLWGRELAFQGAVLSLLLLHLAVLVAVAINTRGRS